MFRRVPVFVWLLALVAGCSQNERRVVLYCAQDEEFATPLFDGFKSRSGFTIAAKFDTEAKKTVGLFTELVNDKNRPRCDVFWNNELLGTIRLGKLGLLQAYDSPAAAGYPPSARGADHTWYAFAARARVLLVNTKLVAPGERPKSLLDLTDPRWKDRLAMAVPLYGTTATQAACLFDALGGEPAKEYYRGLKANHVQLAPGNKQVAEWVGKGQTPNGAVVAVGLTDTDDAMEEVHSGSPVTIVLLDADGAPESKLGTLVIPNSLCILKGRPHPEAAQQLVDYLLSAGVEARLAEGGGYQIPLNPAVEVPLPAEFAGVRKAKQMRVNWDHAADLWDETQRFLNQEIVVP